MTDPRLPEIYEQFTRQYPDLAAAYEQLSAAAHAAGPLAARERRLLKLGAAIGADSPGAVRSHVRKALGEGFDRAEIEHAIVLSLTTVGFPQMIAALTWAKEILDTTSAVNPDA